MAGRRSTALILGFFSLSLAGCGGAMDGTQPEVHGMIARVNGKVRAVTEDERAKLCSQTKCEPNYVYHASFGQAPLLPEILPLPPNSSQPPGQEPSAQPTLPPSFSSGTDYIDYAKTLMHVQQAWQQSEGVETVLVAVVDTGVDSTHQDLQSNLWKDASGNAGWNFITGLGGAEDDNGHGTHVAGIVAAELNGFGTVGIAPKVKVMPVKFMDATGTGELVAAINAIDYATANGAKIISNSWGGAPYSQLMADSVANAVSLGVTVIAAAGNNSASNDATPFYPASLPGVLAVASSNEQDVLSSFSNYGTNSVMIAAPGSDIISTYLGGGYLELSGTSMAAPQVAGALALALSVNPSLTAAQLKQALCSSAKKILATQVSCGRLDVAALLGALPGAAAP